MEILMNSILYLKFDLFIDKMKTIFFKKNGEIVLVDRFTQEEEKVFDITFYLDCPVRLEKGILFGTFFTHLLKEKDFLNIVFKETMSDTNLDPFVKEWERKGTPFISGKGIQYIKAYKIFDYIELPTEESFVDIRIDFDGVGVEDELFNLEFVPINELKNIPFILSDKITLYRTVANVKGEEIFFDSKSFTTLFELVGTILYVLTIHKTPAGRESAKLKFIKILSETNIIEMLEEQKESAVEVQNYEEAAHLKKILDRLKNGFTND